MNNEELVERIREDAKGEDWNAKEVIQELAGIEIEYNGDSDDE